MLNFQIGKKYRRRDGIITECTEVNRNHNLVYFKEGSCVFFDNGACYRNKEQKTPHDIIEEVNEMKIEVGKYYKTHSGNKAFIGYKINKGASYPLVGHIENTNGEYYERCNWCLNGSVANRNDYDLIEEWKEPKSGVRYLNVYTNAVNTIGEYTYMLASERDVADTYNKNRIACVRVEWKEGQFDE
jgi:hypothetical protein